MAKQASNLASKPNVFDLVKDKAKPSAPLTDTGLALSPYVQFAHPMSKNYVNMVAALKSVPTGSPVLVSPDGSYTKLDPFQFLATPAFYQYFGEYDDQGELIIAIEAIGRCPKGMSESVIAVMVVLIGNDLQPVRCRFKGAKCPVIKTAINAVMDTEAEDFAGRGKDHAKLVKSGSPAWSWLLHTGTMTEVKSKPGIGKDGKQHSGYTYHTCESTSVLTPASVVGTLLKLNSDESFSNTMTQCLEDFNTEVEKTQALIG